MTAKSDFLGSGYHYVLADREISQGAADLDGRIPLVGHIGQYYKQVHVARVGGRAPCMRPEENEPRRLEAVYNSVHHNRYECLRGRYFHAILPIGDGQFQRHPNGVSGTLPRAVDGSGAARPR